MTAITAVTAQNTIGVQKTETLDPGLVRAQIQSVVDDIGVDAIKIGMVGSPGVIDAIAGALEDVPPCPLVLDPVMVATSGDALISDGAVTVLRERLFERTTLLTPNLPEAERLVGRTLETTSDIIRAAKELGESGAAVLVKGAHAPSAQGAEIVDVLWNGEKAEFYRHPWIDSTHDHGTGCTLSSAIAAHLALGRELERAVGLAIEFVEKAMRNAFPHGKGRGPLNHAFLKVTPGNV